MSSLSAWEVDCLAYDPFEGGDDGCERILSDRMATARKKRPCCICGGNVKPRTRVRVQSAVVDGEMKSYAMCHGCCKAMAAACVGPEDEDEEWGWAIERRSAVGMSRAAALPWPDGRRWSHPARQYWADVP